jgi:hypothetical protein
MGHPKVRKHLTPIERNFLYYVKSHMFKYKESPCFVPQPFNNQLKEYLRGILWLEQNNFIKIHREPNAHYRTWIVKPGSKFNLNDNSNETETVNKKFH